MFWGGTAGKKLWQEFIEKLFLKSSNEIRQGKGIWQGLTQEQWIKQHDNLTKKLKEWEMGGKKSLPKDMKEYFGMNEIQLTNKFKIETGQIKPSFSLNRERLLKRHPGLPEKEVNRLMELPYQDVVKELDSLAALEAMPIKGKPHATGGRVSLSAGGLAGILGE